MLAPRLTLGARLTLVGGKGGVGKTTIATALAVECADSGEPVTILSIDPAHSLGDALALDLGPDPTPHPALPTLLALEVDPATERDRFLAKYGEHIDILIERGTYLSNEDLADFGDLTLPGTDEIAALLALARAAGDPARRIIVDTAPTGHTLRLLELPQLALGWLAALEAMEAKHAAVAGAFGGRYKPDAAGRALMTLRDEITGVSRLFGDPEATRFVLVTTDEPGVLPETIRFHDRLAELGIAPGGIVVNRDCGGTLPQGERGGVVFIPELQGSLAGLTGVRRVVAVAGAESAPSDRDAIRASTLSAGAAPFASLLQRPLVIVGGKGGVGKSSVAAAIAVRLAAGGARRVLLLSVDPAGSLGEVLGVPVGAAPEAVPGVAGLMAQQLDAAGAWSRFQEQYREEIERLFDAMGTGSGATLDRQVARSVIDLAPPGVDEVMAMLEVLDLSEDPAYDAIVVDTAPTGHLLRLLEMPRLALEWAHALLRILLKYREVIGLSGIGERVLQLSRRIRTLRDQLVDPERTALLLVALPESLSVTETVRTVPRLRKLGVPVAGLLVNRAYRGHAVLHADRITALAGAARGVPVALAPVLPEGPASPAALERFAQAWRTHDASAAAT